MTLLELRKLAENATHNHKDDFRGWIKESHVKEFNKTMNPSTALRMIELLERAAGYIQNAELKECVNCPENSPTPIEECMQCQTARMAYKWLKDLEEL